MKTKSKLKVALLALIFGSTTFVQAQTLKTPALSPLQTLKQAFALTDISIEYSRPSARGRVVFGDLVPYGKMWRTGANASTKITFGEDVKVEGNAVKAGTYALYTIPGKDVWEVLFYKDLKLGGNTSAYKTEDELFRIKVKPASLGEMVETFTMNISDMAPTSTNIEMSWEKTRIKFNVKADIDSMVMASIDKTVTQDNRPYYQAASYYYDNGKDLKIALDWVTKAAAQNPKAYWVMLLKAKIEYKLGDYAACKASADKVKELTKEAEYHKMADELIASIPKLK